MGVWQAALQDELTGALMAPARAAKGNALPAGSTYQATIEKDRAETTMFVPEGGKRESPPSKNDEHYKNALLKLERGSSLFRNPSLRGMAADAYTIPLCRITKTPMPIPFSVKRYSTWVIRDHRRFDIHRTPSR